MYWPVGSIRRVRDEHLGAGETILAFQFSRRNNLFITLGQYSLTLWSPEPTCRIARVDRTTESREHYGDNQLVEWSSDGHSLFVSTTTGHILIYDLVDSASGTRLTEFSLRTPRINIDVPHILQAFLPGAGQGEVYDTSPTALMTSTNIPELRLRTGGIMRFKHGIIGQVHLGGHLSTAPRGLVVALEDVGPIAPSTETRTRSRGGFLRIPHKIPAKVIWKGSRTQSAPQDWAWVDDDEEEQVDIDKWSWEDVGVRLMDDESVVHFSSTRMPSVLSVLTSHGNAFLLFPSTSSEGHSQLPEKQPLDKDLRWTSMQVFASLGTSGEREKATAIDLNPSFGLCTVGTSKGSLVTVKLDSSHSSSPAWSRHCPIMKRESKDGKSCCQPVEFQLTPVAATCAVRSLSWTTDGYALAVQMETGWASYSSLGDLTFRHRQLPEKGSDNQEEGTIIPIATSVEPADGHQCAGLAWLPGNYALMILGGKRTPSATMEIVPFAKSSSTMQQDHLSAYRCLVLHDEVRVFRGADRSAEGALDTTKNLFESVKLPLAYVIHHWPIRYTVISRDGTLLACAGRNGLTHYSFSSGRWKLFAEIAEENSFTVRGGMIWFYHVLIAAIDINGHHEIHLYSRDLDLDLRNVLHIERMEHSVLTMSLDDDILLVYTSDNVLHHFQVQPTSETVELQHCASISLADFISTPNRVRSITWAVPRTARLQGNKAEYGTLASILILAEGCLTILEKGPKGYRLLTDEPCLTYDGPLGNAGVVWSHTGRQIQLIHGLTSKRPTVKKLQCTVPETAEGNDTGSLLAITPASGLAVKLLSSTSGTMSEETPAFELSLEPILFLPTLLKGLLDEEGVTFTVAFGGKFAQLPYFGHVLEVLLLQALEHEFSRHRSSVNGNHLSNVAKAKTTASAHTGLSKVIRFMDYFPQSRGAVIACARKCEAEMWPTLFETAGSPRKLFQDCLEATPPALEQASSLLVIMHTLDQTVQLQQDIRRLLMSAFDGNEDEVAKDIIRFAITVGENVDGLPDLLETRQELQLVRGGRATE